MKDQKPKIFRTDNEMRAEVQAWRGNGEKIGLVPTMGALHEGHLHLVKEASDNADRVIVSIFVNPTQFAEGEDYGDYPRTWESDLAALTTLGVDAIYAPTVETMYPDGFATEVIVGGPALVLEGTSRPQFFKGVATVVTKLILGTLPDIAMFGEKDFQQLLVVKQMVRDLQLPVAIIGVPTVREEDGLALSSRNQYLTDQERQTAPFLHRTLQDCAKRLRNGEEWSAVHDNAVADLTNAGFNVDYLELRHSATLSPVVDGNAERRLLVAARLGKPRLIDNIAV